jgi:hypothetical protein
VEKRVVFRKKITKNDGQIARNMLQWGRRKHGQENRKNFTSAGKAGKKGRCQESPGQAQGRARQENGQSPGKNRLSPQKAGQSRPGKKNADKGNQVQSRFPPKTRKFPRSLLSGDGAQRPKAPFAPPPIIGISQVIAL